MLVTVVIKWKLRILSTGWVKYSFISKIILLLQVIVLLLLDIGKNLEVSTVQCSFVSCSQGWNGLVQWVKSLQVSIKGLAVIKTQQTCFIQHFLSLITTEFILPGFALLYCKKICSVYLVISSKKYVQVLSAALFFF